MCECEVEGDMSRDKDANASDWCDVGDVAALALSFWLGEEDIGSYVMEAEDGKSSGSGNGRLMIRRQ